MKLINVLDDDSIANEQDGIANRIKNCFKCGVKYDNKRLKSRGAINRESHVTKEDQKLKNGLVNTAFNQEEQLSENRCPFQNGEISLDQENKPLYLKNLLEGTQLSDTLHLKVVEVSESMSLIFCSHIGNGMELVQFSFAVAIS